MCVYIYIYIYMDEYVWVSLCVCGWVTQEGILYSVSLTCVRVSRRTSLAQRPHKELFQRKPAKPEEKDKGRLSVRSETQKQRFRHSELGTCSWAVKNEDTVQWGWWPDESVFLVAVWNFCWVLTMATHKNRAKKCPHRLLSSCSSKSEFVCHSFHHHACLCFLIIFFWHLRVLFQRLFNATSWHINHCSVI